MTGMNDTATSGDGRFAETEVTPAALAFWRRLPVVVRAVLAGLAMASAGTLPWAFLVSENIRHAATWPWAVPPTALYLWFFWRYANGAGWPRATANSRRTSARASRLPGDVWGIAIMAGVLMLVIGALAVSAYVALARTVRADASRGS